MSEFSFPSHTPDRPQESHIADTKIMAQQEQTKPAPRPLETTLQKSLTRAELFRTAYKAVLVGGISLAVSEATNTTMEVLRGRDYVSIENIDNRQRSAARRFPHTTSLYYPGLNNNWEDSTRAVKGMQNTLSSIGQMARVGYPNTGFDEQEIFDASLAYCKMNSMDTVHLVGGSLGGILATRLAPRFEAEGISVPSIHLLNSPFGAQDVIQKDDFDRVANLPFDIPELIRGAMVMGQDLSQLDGGDLMECLKRSIERSGTQACSPQLFKSQIEYIADIKLGKLQGKLGAAKLAYYGNRHDKVVDFHSATAHYQAAFPDNFMPRVYNTGTVPHDSASGNNGEAAIYSQRMTSALYDMQLIKQPSKLPNRPV